MKRVSKTNSEIGCLEFSSIEEMHTILQSCGIVILDFQSGSEILNTFIDIVDMHELHL